MACAHDNIEELLSALREDTLAHELVSLIRDTKVADWKKMLRNRLKSKVTEEVNRVRNAANNKD